MPTFFASHPGEAPCPPSFSFLPQPALLTSLGLGLLLPACIFVLGQPSDHNELATVQAELGPAATVVLVDLQVAEAHGYPAELTLGGALLAFRGLWGGGQDWRGHWPAVTGLQPTWGHELISLGDEGQ